VLPWIDGEDLQKLPLIERKQRLHELIQRSRCHAIIYAQHIEGQDFSRRFVRGI
jgi:ATP-dependent DNA ligase